MSPDDMVIRIALFPSKIAPGVGRAGSFGGEEEGGGDPRDFCFPNIYRDSAPSAQVYSGPLSRRAACIKSSRTVTW